MVDKASGNTSANHLTNNPVDQTSTKPAGEKDSQSVTTHSPQGSQLDRSPSKTARTSLKARNVTPYKQTQSIQSYDISTARRLALTGQWPGVMSTIKLHVSDQTQLSQLLHGLGSAINYPPEVQDAICNEFSTHCANRTAGILVSNLSDDPAEAHGSLLLIIDKPERHDSPIGFLSRQSSKEFVKEHSFDEADLPLLIFKTSEKTYDQVVERVNQLEEQMLETADDAEASEIRHSRNERTLETNYRREQETVG